MHHFIPQAPCLVTASGEWAADYVVRTENLEDDMREVRQWVGSYGVNAVEHVNVAHVEVLLSASGKLSA